MSEQSLAAKEAMAAVDHTFAPWVADLGLELIECSKSGARLRLPQNKALELRAGPGVGVICGQAMAAVADTACVYALTGANGRFRNCTTTDMSVRFVRPLPGGDVDVRVELESNGRKLAVCRVTLTAAGSPKTACLATATFMYLEE